jgi:hypothetical protein
MTGSSDQEAPVILSAAKDLIAVCIETNSSIGTDIEILRCASVIAVKGQSIERAMLAATSFCTWSEPT